jgi:hypothetical protein
MKWVLWGKRAAGLSSGDLGSKGPVTSQILLHKNLNFPKISTFYARQMLRNNPTTSSLTLAVWSLPDLLLHYRHFGKFPLLFTTSPSPIKSLVYEPMHIPIPPYPFPKEVIPDYILLCRHFSCHFIPVMFDVFRCAPTCVDNMGSCSIDCQRHDRTEDMVQ